MKHLTTEELLLLADGELQGDAPAHFEACSECRAALGTLQGRLTSISSALRSSIESEPVEMPARSWARLEAGLMRSAVAADYHLTREELLLHLDGALPAERARHLDGCAECGIAGLRMRSLLSDVEHELRSLIPDEPLERRLAAHEALRRELQPAAKVVEFPMRWSVAYVAAAAAVAIVFAGAWLGQRPVERPTQAASAVVEPLAPARAAASMAQGDDTHSPDQFVADAVTSEMIAAETIPAQAVKAEAVAALEATQAEVFTASFTREVQPPAVDALAPADVPPSLIAAVYPNAFRLNAEFSIPEPPARKAPAAVSDLEPQSPHDRLRVLEGRRLLVEAGMWREDVRPVIRSGSLVLEGTVEDAATLARFKQAVLRRSGDSQPVFEIALRSNRTDPAARRGGQVAGSAPGGLVRTALVEHYRDAARRSFRAAPPAALDGEIARYIDGIYRNQDQLLEHAYALEQITSDAAAADVDDPARAGEILDSLAAFHVKRAEDLEAGIYDSLSEALPRKYWNYRPQGDDAVLPEDSLAEQSHALLAEVLALDENLTTLFTGSSHTVNIASGERSSGELLHRIHTRLRRLTDLSRESR